MVEISLPPLDKTIAVLGSFEGRNKEFLEELKTILNSKPYSYFVGIVDEISIPKEIKTPRRKLHFILSAVNFVVADDSYPSGEILELEYSRNCGAIVAILSRSRRSSWMTLDCSIHSNDFKIFECNDRKLEDVLAEANDWANKRREYVDEEMTKFENIMNEQRKSEIKEALF